MATERTALIAGAGIGGLAAGLALRRAGWRVRIFERAASPRELGFALNLAPNAIRALRELGLADQLTAKGHLISEVEVRRGGGRVLKRFRVPAATAETPSVMALRTVLHGTLLKATDATSLVFGSEVIGFEQAGDKVALHLAGGRSDGGDILIGADGVASAIRQQLRPVEPGPRRSGYSAVRGVAHGAGHHLGSLSAVVYLGHGVEAATVRASEDAVYWYISLLTEDVPPGTTDPRDVVARVREQLDDGFRAIEGATRDEDLRLDELFDRDPIADWGRGPVTLLGDAAHPMLPHTGQGAAQALEDAVALGLALDAADDLPAALRRYERVRAVRTAKIVRRGRRMVGFLTSKSRLVDTLRTAALRVMPAKPLISAFLLADGADPHRLLRAHGDRP